MPKKIYLKILILGGLLSIIAVLYKTSSKSPKIKEDQHPLEKKSQQSDASYFSSSTDSLDTSQSGHPEKSSSSPGGVKPDLGDWQRISKISDKLKTAPTSDLIKYNDRQLNKDKGSPYLGILHQEMISRLNEYDSQVEEYLLDCLDTPKKSQAAIFLLAQSTRADMYEALLKLEADERRHPADRSITREALAKFSPKDWPLRESKKLAELTYQFLQKNPPTPSQTIVFGRIFLKTNHLQGIEDLSDKACSKSPSSFLITNICQDLLDSSL